MDEAARAVVLRAGALQDFLDRGAVAETNRRAGGVNGELPREVARELGLVGEEQAFEFADILERAAIREHPARIHGQRVVKRERPAVFAEAALRDAVFRGR